MDLFPAARSTTLPPGATAAVLAAEGPCGGWRLVTVTAPSPVEVVMTWAGRGSPGLPARWSVSRSGQALVWARSLHVEAVNPGAESVAVFASAVETAGCRDVATLLDEAHGAQPVAGLLPIPAWAEFVRLDTVLAAQADAVLELLDAAGTARAAFKPADQPDFVPLGAAHQLRISCGAPFRLLYRLRLV